MEVVNVRVSHIRKEGYNNLKEWCLILEKKDIII